ncbi:MAG: dienelactone hydrolase family protein [Methanotrichaceae archaeon]
MKIALIFLCLIVLIIPGSSQINPSPMAIKNETVQISSGGKIYPAYFAAPNEGKWPVVVLIHSFNGLEPGYKTLCNNFASQGFAVIAPEWQTFNKSSRDEVVGQLIKDSISYLTTRNEANTSSLGLTGFCAGGRYTMLFLPQMPELKSGVAFYGFPYSGGNYNQSKPADFIAQLKAPMLMIHGTHDQASKISDIYRYATDLNASGKYFELKVYYGEPHGFMVQNGQLSQSFPAKDAFWQMVTFFNRTLR